MAARSVVVAFPLSARHGGGARGVWREVLRVIVTRRQLREMDDRMLSDIGITRAEALAEAERAPWDTGPRGALRSAGR